MISRRNIRVKVMQTLYALETQESLISSGEAIQLLRQHFGQSRQLLVYLIFVLTEVALYAETNARNRAAKHLPTQEDLQVNTKICGNETLLKILAQPSYLQALKEDRTQLLNDAELTRRIYLELIGTEEYLRYIQAPSRDRKTEREILEFLFTGVMLANESFLSSTEEKFSNWDDDAEMAQQLVTGFLAKPGSYNFQELISPDKWTFASDLLKTAIDKKELTMEYVKPKLKNWDVERIAVLDMLLMRLGVCEFLFFETIPPKVSINEYIDLAKEYSTGQSGQFINGILDSIHKDLVKDDKMHKVPFKQS